MILQNMDKKEREFRRDLNVINGYMKQKNINLELRTKIRNYFEFVWNEDQLYNNETTQEVINKLSRSLKEELLVNANGVVLKKFDLFQKNFSETLLRKVVFIMKEIKLFPGDLLYKPNELTDSSLYIIKKGEVELFVESSNENDYTNIQKLNEGELFGELSFFADTARKTGARSSTFTSLYVIQRQNFLDILKENTLDYEHFCQIKDQILLYNNYDHLYLRCFVCKESNHPTNFCPFLRLNLSDQRILDKFNYSQKQERVLFEMNLEKSKLYYVKKKSQQL